MCASSGVFIPGVQAPGAGGAAGGRVAERVQAAVARASGGARRCGPALRTRRSSSWWPSPYGIELRGTGAVDMMSGASSRVLHDPWRELRIRRSNCAEAVRADQTTWLCKADPCWLWTATTAALVCTALRIDPRPTQEPRRSFRGTTSRFVTSDRYVGSAGSTCWNSSCAGHTPWPAGRCTTSRRARQARRPAARDHRPAVPGPPRAPPALAVADLPSTPRSSRCASNFSRCAAVTACSSGTRGRRPKTARFYDGLCRDSPRSGRSPRCPASAPRTMTRQSDARAGDLRRSPAAPDPSAATAGSNGSSPRSGPAAAKADQHPSIYTTR